MLIHFKFEYQVLYVDEHLVLDYYGTLQFDLFTGQFGYLIVFFASA